MTTSLIKHIQEDNIFEYKKEVRKLIPDNNINFPLIINDGLPLALLLKSEGENAYKIVAKMIAKFCGNFNVVRNMTPEQIVDYAYILIDENMNGSLPYNPGYRLEDLAVFFERAKTGRYGKPFDHIDCSVIDGMLDKYHEERVEDYNRTQYILKNNEDNKLSDEQIEKSNIILNELIEKAQQISNNPIKENSVNKQELIRLERIQKQKIEFFGGEYYKNVIEVQEKELIQKIEELRKKVELENE